MSFLCALCVKKNQRRPNLVSPTFVLKRRIFTPKKSDMLLFFIHSLCFAPTAVWQQPTPSSNTAQPDTSIYGSTAALADLDTVSVQKPYTAAYLANVRTALAQPTPILQLPNLPTEADAAQKIAVADARFQQFLREPQTQQPFRNEIFGVYAARMSDFTPQNMATFQRGGCYRVELYNYARNMATIGLISVPEQRAIAVYTTPYMQPDIPPHLKQLALRIAADAPQVRAALGYTPNIADALMADTKTALNRSRCERSAHLCVAPTFVKGDKALWAIVDLTNLRLVGVRWTNVGNAGPARPITERFLQNENLTECFCKTVTPLARNGWQLNYMLTSSDGLRISEVTYKGAPVLQSAKLVDWHVSYSNTDGFGYSDAVGCPYFSTAAVIAIESPKVRALVEGDKTVGFVLEQSYYSEGWPQPCNYNYQQRYEFYDDGRFRIAAASFGRGCGNDGTYRPVFRIAMSNDQRFFREYMDNEWQLWSMEGWRQQTRLFPPSPEGYQYQIGNYYMLPNFGNKADGGRGDNAYMYIMAQHPDRDEGDADLPTLGTCCNNDYRQGPERYTEPNPDDLGADPLVLWYVPQLKNDDTKGSEYCWATAFLQNGVWATRAYPCWAGPMFVPIKK